MDFSQRTHVKPPAGAEGSRTRVKPGDIVISITADVGMIAVVPEDIGEAYVNQHVALVRPSPGVDSRALAYALSDPTGLQKLVKKIQYGATKASLSLNQVREFPVPLPPLNEQRRIVARIEELTARSKTAKEALQAIPPLLEKFRQSVLAAAFRGDLTADWRLENPFPDDAGSIVDEVRRSRQQVQVDSRKKQTLSESSCPDKSKQPPLPRSWTWTTLGDCFAIYVGATPSRKEPRYWGGDIPWVSSGEVKFRTINSTKECITADGLENTSTSLHPPGTVLLSMIGEGKTRGQAAILGIEACNSQNSAAIRLGETRISPEYLYYWLVRQYENNRRIGSGNNQQALNKRRVQDIPIPLAPLGEQKALIARIEGLLSFQDLHQDSYRAIFDTILKLNRSILSQAFQGKL